MCRPWLTGRAELEGFQRHLCSWEIAPRLCVTRARQGQSENNCTGLCRGEELTSRMEKMGVEACSKVFYCPELSKGKELSSRMEKQLYKCAPRCFTVQNCAERRNSLPGWEKKWLWQCALRCFTAQESFSEPVNNVLWEVSLGATKKPTEGGG